MNVRRLSSVDKDLIVDFWCNKESLWGGTEHMAQEEVLRRFNKYFIEETKTHSVYAYIVDNQIQLALGSYSWKNAPYFTVFDFAKRKNQKINIKKYLSETMHRLVADMLLEEKHSFYYPMKSSHIAKYTLRSEEGVNSIEKLIPIFKLFTFNIEEIIPPNCKTRYSFYKDMIGGAYEKEIVIRRGTLKPKWFKMMNDKALSLQTIEKILKDLK